MRRQIPVGWLDLHPLTHSLGLTGMPRASKAARSIVELREPVNTRQRSLGNCANTAPSSGVQSRTITAASACHQCRPLQRQMVHRQRDQRFDMGCVANAPASIDPFTRPASAQYRVLQALEFSFQLRIGHRVLEG